MFKNPLKRQKIDRNTIKLQLSQVQSLSEPFPDSNINSSNALANQDGIA
jgi:hypothetical protein